MNPPAKKPQQAKRRRKKAKGFDLWRPPAAPMPDAVPVVPLRDPTALLRSLGDPPLQGQAAVAQHYLAAVVERAAGLATALAAAAGTLSTSSPDDE